MDLAPVQSLQVCSSTEENPVSRVLKPRMMKALLSMLSRGENAKSGSILFTSSYRPGNDGVVTRINFVICFILRLGVLVLDKGFVQGRGRRK